ncbi:hypothetical protein [Yersinia ruckeri]|uniref:hypothetical protein n=1 Tax=Yersinia ruckeri TaxID=29486 RepID=UPI0022370EE5|nr:hypothetical protein [Yersinia ruckeri]MCW6647691.1 hypothetical protein [Yersinia ruckeri]
MLLCNHTQKSVPYSITSGFDLNLTQQMNSEWSGYKGIIAQEILTNFPTFNQDPTIRNQVVSDYNIGDFGWDWNRKIFFCNTIDYLWFYLIADNKVQSACIIYHPKQSHFDNKPIFYIDYIASANWNRSRPGYSAQFKRTGTLLIEHAIKYANKNWGYRPGFCLHSLPDAEGFYSHLGMQDFGIDPSKENLRIFEAPEVIACKLGGVAHA